jgi:hypothetical protein
MNALYTDAPCGATNCFSNVINRAVVADVRALIEQGLSRDAIASRLCKASVVVDAATIAVVGFRAWKAARRAP